MFVKLEPYNLIQERDKKSQEVRLYEEELLKTQLEKVLNLLGYKDVTNNHTGGDNDYFIVDTKRKEWTYWEHGFSPFRSNVLPSEKTLTYWIKNRH